MTPRWLTVGLLLASCAAFAQEIEVYSEFRRVGPFGEIVPADRGGRPREILSPLMARNSHTTLFAVTHAPPGKIYYFYVTTNPKGVLDVTVYKALYARQGNAWVPDRLVQIETPYTSHLPDRYHGIPDQTAELFVIDVWVSRDAEPGRMKLDLQMNVDSRWLVYPMEVRISTVVAPEVALGGGRLPPVTASADASVLGPLREYLCGVREPRGSGPLSIRQLIHRNALEDVALARKGGGDVSLLRGLGLTPSAFCETQHLESPNGPEWYLHGRDFLYRGTVDYY